MAPIYLDYHATTPTLPHVLEAMQPFFTEHFGNPSSQHSWGWKANLAVSKARHNVAKLFNSSPENFLFTSGATESIHMAILGWLLAQKSPSECQIITSEIEHKATLGACKIAQKMGAATIIIPVNKFGQVETSALAPYLDTNKKTLVSLIHGHNEIGTMNDVAAIAKFLKNDPNAIFHIDAAQSTGKTLIDLSALTVHMLSFSGHKMYAPKGIGGLFVRDARLIHSLFSGGGQEFNLRAGTLNVPGIVGLGVACQWALENAEQEAKRLQSLRDLFFHLISENSSNIKINGHPTERLPHNINITIKGVSSESLSDALEGIGYSAGSACGSNRSEPNHVHQGIGMSEADSKTTLRFGLGHSTTEAHIRSLAQKIISISKS